MAALGVICIPTSSHFSVGTAQPRSWAKCLIHSVHIWNTSFQLGQQAKLPSRSKKSNISIFTPRTGTLALCPSPVPLGADSGCSLHLFLRPTQVIILMIPRKQMKSSLAHLEWHELIGSCSVSALTSICAHNEMQMREEAGSGRTSLQSCRGTESWGI